MSLPLFGYNLEAQLASMKTVKVLRDAEGCSTATTKNSGHACRRTLQG
jgi:hypothetical protein